MKANLFAVVLSLFVVSISLHAANIPPNPQPVKVIPATKKIDLNKADAKTLSKSVKGIGLKRAEAIVKYREDHGKFNSLEDLAKVKGIGERFVKSHKSQLQEAFAVN